MTMNVQERIQHQLGALMLANIQLVTENETLKSQLENMMAKIDALSAKPESEYPDKRVFAGGDGSTPV